MVRDGERDDPLRHAQGSNPWIPAGLALAAVVLVTLDTTIVNVALHDIGLDLDAGTAVAWVATAYFLGTCSSMPLSGWLADRVGRKRVILFGFTVFVIASIGCASAPNLGALIAWRVLQGMGGGVVSPVAMALVMSLFPKEQLAKAMAATSMAILLTPALGPTIGGFLVTSVSWHWMFLVNIPIGLVVIALGITRIPDVGHRSTHPLDAAGLVLGSGGLALTALGLMEGNTWGWDSVSTVLCLVLGVTGLATFTRHELRTPHPMIELRMFSDRSFTLAIVSSNLLIMCMFSRLVFVPLELESIRGYSALRVGLMLSPAAAVGMVTSWMGGRIAERVGPRRPIIGGAIIVMVGTVGLSQLGESTADAVIVGFMSLQSVGIGFVMAPAMLLGLQRLPPRLVAQGTAVRSLAGNVAGALAVAVFGAVLATRLGDAPSSEEMQTAYNSVFLAASGAALLGLLLATRLRPGRDDPGRDDPAAAGATQAATTSDGLRAATALPAE